MDRELTLWVVIVAGLIDSINPCAIGVLLFLSSVLVKVADQKRRLLHLGLVYVATVYVVYVLSGLGLIWFQRTLIKAGWAETLGVVVGVAVIILGLIEIKEFFWHGRWISLEIAPRHKERIQKMAGTISLAGVIALGGFVAVVELPCTGGPYLAITAILAKGFDIQALAYLLVYNALFVLPLVVILFLIYFGTSTLRLKKWRETKRKWMNLATGLLMLSLGVFLILYHKFGWFV